MRFFTRGAAIAGLSIAFSFSLKVPAADSTSAKPGEFRKQNIRVPLITMFLRTYQDRSNLDLGVQASRDEKGDLKGCRILFPRDSKAAAEEWAPFHFYTKIHTLEEQEDRKKAGDLGVPDLFYLGDDNNRNVSALDFLKSPLPNQAQGDSYLRTRRVELRYRKCFRFTERSPEKLDPNSVFDRFSFLVSFNRGPLKWQHLVVVKAQPVDNHCETRVFLCAPGKEYRNAEGKIACNDEDLDRWMHAVFAEPSKRGYVASYFEPNETRKSDLYSLEASVSRLKDDRPLAEPENELMCKQ